MIEGILYSLLGTEAFNIVKKGLKKFGPEFEEDEIIEAAYHAAQHAYRAFFKKYKKRFGEESRRITPAGLWRSWKNSFLAATPN